MSTITGGPMKIEQVIFNNLLYNEDFARKSLPHLKQEYFSDFIENKIYSTIEKYVGEYNKIPSKEAIIIDLSNAKGITDEQFAKAKTYIQDINEPERQDVDWLVNQTEKFCQDKAIYNAIVNSIKILDGDNTNLSKGSIPGLLTDALSVSFDTSIGHDFLENADARYDYYHTKQHKIPFDLEYMNKITKGGLPRKTLNVFLAGCVHPSTKIKVRIKKR
jgi:hypothetical protein